MNFSRLLNLSGTLGHASRIRCFSYPRQCALDGSQCLPRYMYVPDSSLALLPTCAWSTSHCYSMYQKSTHRGANLERTWRTMHVSCVSAAGHNKWSKIKRKKAVTDLEKSKARTKLLDQIRTVVASGGNDPTTNIRLSGLLTQARSSGVPKTSVESALKWSASGTGGVVREAVMYEGKGPSRYLVLIEALTDNRNRTRGQIRHIFAQQGGVLGEPGSSAFMFEQKAIIQLSTQQLSLDPLELAIEIGAEDVHTETDPENVVVVHLICEPNELNSVCAAVRERGLGVSSTSLEYLPKSFKSLTQEQFEKAEKLVELLSEQSDVVAVYSNHELS